MTASPPDLDEPAAPRPALMGSKAVLVVLALLLLAGAVSGLQRYRRAQAEARQALARPAPAEAPAASPEAPPAPVAPASASLPPSSSSAAPPSEAPARAAARIAGAPPRPLAGPGAPVTAPLGAGAPSAPRVYATVAACADCGWIESVQAAPGSGGLPPAALAAAGAVAGAQAGGRAVGTGAAQGAGAALGAATLAGGAASSGYEIRVRMEDGSLRVVRAPEPLPLGASVRLVAGQPQLAPRPAPEAPAGGRVYGTR